MSAPLLQVEDLSVAFAGREVVHGLAFQIQPGEKLALVGESGSGKTVTALSLLGLAQGGTVRGRALFAQTQGPVDLLTLPPRQLQALRGQDIAMVFQEPMTALNPVFTIGEQIAEVLQLKKGLSPAESAQAAIQLIADTGIAEPQRRAGAYPHQLSGGQRQRAMIAMALACRPKVLIADEPTTALDPTVQAQILQLIRGLQKDFGTAVIFISHDLGVISQVADETAVLYAGQVVERGPTREMFRAPLHPYTRGLLRALPDPDASEMAEVLFEIKGCVPSPDELPSGCRFNPRCELARAVCRSQAPAPWVRDNIHMVSCWEYEHG